MSDAAPRTVSLRFSEADYRKLKDQAAALGLKPAVLARVIVRTSLNAPPQDRARTSRRQFSATLTSLREMVATGGGAAVDPVELIHRVRQGRGEQLRKVLDPPPAPG